MKFITWKLLCNRQNATGDRSLTVLLHEHTPEHHQASLINLLSQTMAFFTHGTCVSSSFPLWAFPLSCISKFSDCVCPAPFTCAFLSSTLHAHIHSFDLKPVPIKYFFVCLISILLQNRSLILQCNCWQPSSTESHCSPSKFLL